MGAGIEQAGVVDDPIAVVVLGREAQNTRLDAQVDVLGDQDDGALGTERPERDGHGQDDVVRLVAGHGRRQVHAELLGLQEQASAPRPQRSHRFPGEVAVASARRLRERQPLLDGPAVGVADQLIQEAADLAGVARQLRGAFLGRVQLLQDHHGHVQVVLLEAEQRRRIVQQHIGVEHEQPWTGLGDHRGAPLGWSRAPKGSLAPATPRRRGLPP